MFAIAPTLHRRVPGTAPDRDACLTRHSAPPPRETAPPPDRPAPEPLAAQHALPTPPPPTGHRFTCRRAVGSRCRTGARHGAAPGRRDGDRRRHHRPRRCHGTREGGRFAALRPHEHGPRGVCALFGSADNRGLRGWVCSRPPSVPGGSDSGTAARSSKSTAASRCMPFRLIFLSIRLTQ